MHRALVKVEQPTRLALRRSLDCQPITLNAWQAGQARLVRHQASPGLTCLDQVTHELLLKPDDRLLGGVQLLAR